MRLPACQPACLPESFCACTGPTQLLPNCRCCCQTAAAGEKEERLEELLEDIQDIKGHYRQQIEFMASQLTALQQQLGGAAAAQAADDA